MVKLALSTTQSTRINITITITITKFHSSAHCSQRNHAVL